MSLFYIVMRWNRLGALFFACLLSTGAAAWTVELDFNKGAAGQKVSGMGAQGRTVYSAERAYEGSQSARLTIHKGEEGYGVWGGYIPHPTNLKRGDELWFRVRTFFPTGFDYYSHSGGGRLKFLRFSTLNAKTGKSEGYNDIYIDKKGSSTPFKFIFEGENRWANVGKSSHWPSFDLWETYEFYVKFDAVPKSEGGHALIRFWKNGELLAEISDRKTLRSVESQVGRTLLFTYWNGGAPRTQSMWVDDLVLTSERPQSKDSHGNPFIGPKTGHSVSPPAPPSLKVAPD